MLTLCEPSLIAMGDATRLQLIKIILDLDKDCKGICVGDLTQKTNLSRPAISHHLKILKEAGIVTLRQEGTKKLLSFRF